MKSHVTESRDIEQDIQQLQAKLDAVERANTRYNDGLFYQLNYLRIELVLLACLCP